MLSDFSENRQLSRRHFLTQVPLFESNVRERLRAGMPPRATNPRRKSFSTTSGRDSTLPPARGAPVFRSHFHPAHACSRRTTSALIQRPQAVFIRPRNRTPGSSFTTPEVRCLRATSRMNSNVSCTCSPASPPINRSARKPNRFAPAPRPWCTKDSARAWRSGDGRSAYRPTTSARWRTPPIQPGEFAPSTKVRSGLEHAT